MPQNRFESDSLLALEQRYEDEQLAIKNSKLIHDIETVWWFIAELTNKDMDAKLEIIRGRWSIGGLMLASTLERSLEIIQSIHIAKVAKR